MQRLHMNSSGRLLEERGLGALVSTVGRGGVGS